MQDKAKAFIALNTFADSRVALIQSMKDAGYATLEACRPVVIEWACDKVGVGAKGYRTTESGKVVLVSTLKQSSSIRTVVNDVMLMLQGTTRRQAAKTNESHKTEPRDQAAILAAAFLKMDKAEQRRFLKLIAA